MLAGLDAFGDCSGKQQSQPNWSMASDMQNPHLRYVRLPQLCSC